MPSPWGLPLPIARVWGLKIMTQNLGPDFGGYISQVGEAIGLIFGTQVDINPR